MCIQLTCTSLLYYIIHCFAASQYITQTPPLNSRGAALPGCYIAPLVVRREATTWINASVKTACPCGAIHPWNFYRTALVRWWCRCSVSTWHLRVSNMAKQTHDWISTRLRAILCRTRPTRLNSRVFLYRRYLMLEMCIWHYSILHCSADFTALFFSLQPGDLMYLSSSRGVLGLLVVSDPKEAGEPQRNALLWIHLRADSQTGSQSVYSTQPLMHVSVCPLLLVLYWKWKTLDVVSTFFERQALKAIKSPLVQGFKTSKIEFFLIEWFLNPTSIHLPLQFSNVPDRIRSYLWR